MRVILSGAVFVAVVLGVFAPAMAQSVRSVGAPAEIPASSFQGQQYVDSRGCVFMRAGLSGRTTWVPRIGRDRKPICNATTAREASARLAAPQTDQSAAAPVQRAGKPMATVASNMVPKRQTGVVMPTFVPGLVQSKSAPARVAVAPVIATGGRAAGCPAEAPVLQRMALNAGGSVVVCTRGDGTANGWVSPSYARGTQPGAAITNVQGQQRMAGAAQQQNQRQAQYTVLAQSGDFGQTVINGKLVVGHQTPNVPQYRAAWDDGRLNPMRSNGAAQGWAQQDQVWTRTTPANSVADVARTKARKQVLAKARLTASTMSGNGGAAIYVQVGTFGNASNVQNAAGALSAMGLPVAKSRGSKGGRELVTVLAGPFASGADAQAALGMARSAGFGDAFLR